MNNSTTQRSALIPLAQGCEELEAVTLIDLLRRAEIKVTTAGLDEHIVTASRGTQLKPDTHLDHAMQTDYDIIILPGGLPGADHLRNDPRIISLIQQQHSAGKLIAAICAAPKVLAHAGILNGKNATCYPGSLSAEELDGVKLSTQAVVQDGNVFTSKGPGTAMDFALVLIENLTDHATRVAVENPLQRT